MKKVFKNLFLAVMMLLTCSVLFAQAAPSNPEEENLFGFLVQFIPVKYQAAVITVLTFLFLLEQYLAKTSKVSANSTFQLVAGWIRSAYNVVRGKKK